MVATSASAFHLSAADVLSTLKSDDSQGLSDAEAAARLQRQGPNELVRSQPVPAWRKLLAQFTELVIWILIAAAIISGLMGEWIDTVAILAIVITNGLIGFFQEQKAEHSLEALKSLSVPVAKVVRAGRLQRVPAQSLVPGDRIELEAGDYVPADGRLLRAFGTRTQEAALTGESAPVEKTADVVLDAATPLADRRNMVFMGTVLAAGRASAVVVDTGMKTELGSIAKLLSQAEVETTPLQRRLTELGKLLVLVCLGIVAGIFVLQLARGGDLLEVGMLSISLGVAAVPEGLPAVVTMVLALGLQRMVKRHALVRKLPSVETLGSVTVICSDKTGTLTHNEMTACAVVAGNKCYRVSGVGYNPEGKIVAVPNIATALADVAEPVAGTHVDDATTTSDDVGLQQLLATAVYCNDAKLAPSPAPRSSWNLIGDPTEGALIALGMKGGVVASEQNRRISEIPFDSQRKAMSVVIENATGERTLYCKGALEVILERCRFELCGAERLELTATRRAEILALQEVMAERAFRVLAFAFRDRPAIVEGRYSEDGLVFVGLVGMIDPPREEVKEAVRRCRAAGIRPIMITGDHQLTARAIGLELQFVGPDDCVLTGQELEALLEPDRAAAIARAVVFARVLAEHKMSIVKAWQARGEVVAMTGDGVNDAPAVKAADVGIAMGLTGTDVTKEAADIVLMDDNFTSIVNAIEEGRGIYDNIQKFVHYLLACNAGEVLFVLFAALLGWPSPLTAVQILWINLVTDGLPALALGLEPPEPDIMQRRPRPPGERLITRSLGLRIFGQGMLLALTSLLAFYVAYTSSGENIEFARTTAFCVVACSQLFFSFACRSARYTLPELGLFTNSYLFGAIALSLVMQFTVVAVPGVQYVFDSTDLPLSAWAFMLLLSLTPVTLVEVAKILLGWLKKRGALRFPPID